MADSKGTALIEIHSLSEIPDGMSEADEAEFWSTHSLDEELLDRMEPVPEALLPSPEGRAGPSGRPF